ncbi:hypothetical protein JN11_00397 [Mucilaginibacter frigoritolerans]|jgi:hypothetical protein|uniref:DoxX-like protein n=1 Tax=Mucilaginibacter frigoritolerans TaxID=652788 RepID=A0A562UH09_9SPHI|nr:hypothetical protein [Mucilaginibacter frigoritolerans]TWJ04677.1 hypothetical protein JN11_00397 [Mucilaginibacter frigoritolerans]
MLIKIITCLIMFFVIFMGFKQGVALVGGKPESVAIFEKANLNPFWQMLFGAFTMAGAIFILHPQLYKSGNIIMAVSILIIIYLQLSFKEIKSAIIELPFLFLNLLLIYLQYPLAN